jgi:hypothetical protein
MTRNTFSVRSNWWQSGWLICAIALASTLPLLVPEIPPLVDVPGHMGRYAIQLGLAGSGAQQWYDFHWALIGNLGVDILAQLFAPLFGLELTVKIIVTLIPALLVAGFLLTAREVHGQLPPTALFAAPLAYAFPFQFGFINFTLSAALAFLALPLWIRLGNSGRLRLRAILFVPISILLWLAHIYGFGLFGILAFATEVWRTRSYRAVFNCLVLIAPIGLTLATRSDTGGAGTVDWFNWARKWDWAQMILRDRWEWFDKGTVLLLAGLPGIALLWRGLRWWGPLAFAAFVFAALFLLMPRIVLGSAYADMRLLPYALACAVLSISASAKLSMRFQHSLAIAALAFFGARTAATSLSLHIADTRIVQVRSALPHIPIGAKLISFVGQPCARIWAKPRLEHMPSMALIRRHAFANDQWDVAGSQLVHVKLLGGSSWTHDPAQLVTPVRCRSDWKPMAEAVRDFPRNQFDWLWIIDKPAAVTLDESGLQPVWRQGPDTLYRILHPAPSNRVE